LLAAKKEILHKDELLQVLQRNGQSQETLHTRIRSLEAQLELLKDNNTILQQEFELKHANNLSLKSEIETLRQAFAVRKEEAILSSPIEEDKVKEPTAMTGGVNNA
jgi:hypothetical protein